MNENKLRLYYTWRDGDKGDCLIEDTLREQWINELSAEKKAAVLRQRNKSNQDSSLLGLQLLKYCARLMQLESFKLSDINHPDVGKPFWRGAALDFNISHSDTLVMLVASTNMKVGLDVEKIRPLKNLNFKSVMHEDELAEIKNQPEHFFRLWSIKEAVVKAADTAGLSRMLDVKIETSQSANIMNNARTCTANFEDQRWYLEQWLFNHDGQKKKYSVAVATSQALDTQSVDIIEPTFVSIDMIRAASDIYSYEADKNK